MEFDTQTFPEAASGRELAMRTTVGVVVALVAVLLARAIVLGLNLDVGPTTGASPFAPASLIGATVVAGIGAAIVYAGAVEYTDRPVRTFLGASLLVFVLMLVPIVVATPEGVTATGQAMLAIYHLLVAGPIVAFVVGAARR